MNNDQTLDAIKTALAMNKILSEDQKQFLDKCQFSTKQIEDMEPEHLAVLLAYLDVPARMQTFELLTPDSKAKVISATANLPNLDFKDLLQNTRIVLEKLAQAIENGYKPAGGVSAAAALVERLASTEQNLVMKNLKNSNSGLHDEIKTSVLVFEDISNLSDNAIQKLMRELDNETLTVALKATDTKVISKILRNMSKRAAALMREDMTNIGQISQSQVEQAQLKIVQVLRSQITGKPMTIREIDEEIV